MTTTQDQLINSVFNNVNLPNVRYNSVGEEPHEVPVPKRRTAEPRIHHSRSGSHASQLSRNSRKSTDRLEKQVELRTTEFYRDANGTATRDEIITERLPLSKSGSRVSSTSESSDSTIKAEPIVDSRGYNTTEVPKEDEVIPVDSRGYNEVVSEIKEVTTIVTNASNGNSRAASIREEVKENKIPVDPTPIDLDQVFQGIPARQVSASIISSSSNKPVIGRHLSRTEQKEVEKALDELDESYRRISTTTHDTSIAGEYNLRRDSRRSQASHVSSHRNQRLSQTEPNDHIYDQVPYEQHLQHVEHTTTTAVPPRPPKHQRQGSDDSDYVVSTFDESDIQDKVLKEIGWKVNEDTKYNTVRSTRSTSSRGNVRITSEIQPTATYVSPLNAGGTMRTLKTGPPKLPSHQENGVVIGGIGQRIQTTTEIGQGARVSEHVHLPPKQPSFRQSARSYAPPPPTPAAPLARQTSHTYSQVPVSRQSSAPRPAFQPVHHTQHVQQVQRQTSIPTPPKAPSVAKAPTHSIRNVALNKTYQKADVNDNKNIYIDKHDEVNIAYHLCGRHEIKKAKKHLKKVQIYEPIPEFIPQLEEQFLQHREQQRYEQQQQQQQQQLLLQQQEEELRRVEQQRYEQLVHQQQVQQVQQVQHAHEPKSPLQVQLEDENNFSFYRKGHVHVEQPVYHKKEREMVNFDELTALEKALLKRRLIEENHVENEKIVTVNLYGQANGNGHANGNDPTYYNKPASRQNSHSTQSSHIHPHANPEVTHQHHGISRQHEQREIHGKHEHYQPHHTCSCQHGPDENLYDVVQNEVEDASIQPVNVLRKQFDPHAKEVVSRPESRRSALESGDLSDGTLQSRLSSQKVEHNAALHRVVHEVHEVVLCPLCQLEDRRRDLDNESVISFPTTIYDQID